MFGFKQDKGDPRVRRALDELGVTYEFENGVFKFIFDVGDGRSQVGFIGSETEEFAGIELRSLWSPGLIATAPLARNILETMLFESAGVKVGAWALNKFDDGRVMALFLTKISADLRGEALAALIMGVLSVADRFEARFSSVDAL